MEDILPQSKWVKFVAGNTLYAYLIHVLLIMLIQEFLFAPSLVSTCWCLPVLIVETLVVGALSLLFSFALKRLMQSLKTLGRTTKNKGD